MPYPKATMKRSTSKAPMRKKATPYRRKAISKYKHTKRTGLNRGGY